MAVNIRPFFKFFFLIWLLYACNGNKNAAATKTVFQSIGDGKTKTLFPLTTGICEKWVGDVRF